MKETFINCFTDEFLFFSFLLVFNSVYVKHEKEEGKKIGGVINVNSKSLVGKTSVQNVAPKDITQLNINQFLRSQ